MIFLLLCGGVKSKISFSNWEGCAYHRQLRKLGSKFVPIPPWCSCSSSASVLLFPIEVLLFLLYLSDPVHVPPIPVPQFLVPHAKTFLSSGMPLLVMFATTISFALYSLNCFASRVWKFFDGIQSIMQQSLRKTFDLECLG
jgi:hypothetical protein